MSLGLRTLCVVALAFTAGCRFAGLPPLPPGAIPPTVAVTSFENRTGARG